MHLDRRRLRLPIVLAALTLVVAACADDPVDDVPEEPVDVEPEEPGEAEAPEAEEPEEAAQPEEPDETEPVATVTVEPECAEIGDGFTVRAAGLEAGAEHSVLVDPPFSPGAEPGTMGEAGADGVLEVPANLPEDSEPGGYTVTLTGDGQEGIATAEFEIAETC